MLEDICISLETARKLVEAGIKIEYYFFWVRTYGFDIESKWEIRTMKELIVLGLDQEIEDDVHEVALFEVYPAPTAEELWELLPFCIGKKPNSDLTPYMKDVTLGGIAYWDRESKEILHLIVIKSTLCESFAKMAIWLKQNGYCVGGERSAEASRL